MLKLFEFLDYSFLVMIFYLLMDETSHDGNKLNMLAALESRVLLHCQLLITTNEKRLLNFLFCFTL